jgi:TrmH family RNA methyltransferase
MLLDGIHLVEEAARAGLRLETVAFTARLMETEAGRRLSDSVAGPGHTEIIQVSDAVMAAMSPVSTPAGVVAIAARPAWTLEQVFERHPPLVVVAADVQEPGNVGAIVRSAEGCGATGVVFCGASADPFGWKALRGSMGSVFRLPTAVAPGTGEVFGAARRHGVRMAATRPRGGLSPRGVDLRQPIAFVLGGEGPGLAPSVLDAADLCVSLPMAGRVESLNVAVAAALLVYEASRQRAT